MASTYAGQGSTQENKHPRPESNSNPRSQHPNGQDPRPRLRGHCDRLEDVELRPTLRACNW